LKKYERALRKRKQSRVWYGYSAPRNLELHDRAQIVVPLLANRGMFALVPEDAHGALCPMASGGFTIAFGDDCAYQPEYVLGLLNSRVLFWMLSSVSNVFRGGWVTCTKQYFGELPIRTLDMNITAQAKKHDELVALVRQVIDVRARLEKAATDHEREYSSGRLSELDRRIDQVVYKLYGLSDREIALVEATTQ
jgi:hypothetical protein